MSQAIATPLLFHLVAAWERVMDTRAPGTPIYDLTAEEAAGMLLWTQGGNVDDALMEAHKLVALAPSARYPFWKDVQSLLWEVRYA